MKLRDGNIIVCSVCGAERNPEITTEHDFIKYIDGIAYCSKCGNSGEVELPVPVVIEIAQGKPATVEELEIAFEVLKQTIVY